MVEKVTQIACYLQFSQKDATVPLYNVSIRIVQTCKWPHLLQGKKKSTHHSSVTTSISFDLVMTMKSRDFTRRHRYPHSPQPTGCFPGKRQCSNAVSHADPTPPTHTGDGRQGGSKRRANTGIESLTASTNQQHNGTRTAEKCGAGGYLAVARQARQPLAQAEFGDGAPAAATWGGEVGGRGRRRSCIPASRSGSLRFCCGAAVRAAVVGGRRVRLSLVRLLVYFGRSTAAQALDWKWKQRGGLWPMGRCYC